MKTFFNCFKLEDTGLICMTKELCATEHIEHKNYEGMQSFKKKLEKKYGAGMIEESHTISKIRELTMKEILDAMKMVKKENTCKKCDTERNLWVLGHEGLFCRCKAKKLFDTPHVKELHAFVKELVKCN